MAKKLPKADTIVDTPEVIELVPLPTKEEVLTQVATPPDEYVEYIQKLSPRVRSKVLRAAAHTRTGLYNVAPLTCMGPDSCPFIEKCPIPERDAVGKLHFGAIGDYPLGQGCVLEQFLMQQKVHDYISHLDIDPNNPVEMSIANELAVIDLYKNRALMVLSAGDRNNHGRDFLKYDVVGVSETGEPMESSKLHPAADMIDRLEKRRQKYLDQLGETRKARKDWLYKMGKNNNESKVLKEIEELRKALIDIPQAPKASLPAPDDEEILID